MLFSLGKNSILGFDTVGGNSLSNNPQRIGTSRDRIGQASDDFPEGDEVFGVKI
jgi:hypothetical protein